MGCVCSKGRDRRGAAHAVRDAPEVGFSDKRRSRYSAYDSGELEILSGKASAGKLSETSIGRASIAGLEKAVEVLDTLGSSMSSLNTGSGFISGAANRGNRITILAFEVANTIAKAATLWKSFSDESIRVLKDDVLKSEGVRLLVSSDEEELLSIAAADKRDELAHFSREVIRFGDLCKDPVWHNLGRYFQKLDSDFASQDLSKAELDASVHQLIDLAHNTSELYHESHALDRFEQDYHRKFREEKVLRGARKESLMILLSELKRQRKHVKGLRKKSLWSRNLEEVVEKLVDIVVFLHKQIRDAFGHAASNSVVYEQGTGKRLGECGLALHYANIINQIDNIVCRPLSLPPSARDNLYHALPNAVKSSLRSRLHAMNDQDEYTVAKIKSEMQKTLSWIMPIAENTIRAHQGFGWVGEWANIGTEVNKKSNQQLNITRIQTLYHANKATTEEYLLDLVVWLHHLVVQVKSRGYGIKSTKQAATLNNSPSQAKEGPSSPQISEDEREMLEKISLDGITLGRSRSFDSYRGGQIMNSKRLFPSRSCGSSPVRELGAAVDWEVEKTRVLDVMDGLDALELYNSNFA
ncbi:hypothetical protein LUZ61_020408 [Rhynchospora tenuis]|uniref:Uncharacterized protein n=1 Tax=Rhynchospora tenuis TaxID=198213 RepID=A0AAD5ZDD3_9POAL|nr:hypothetical protein LUZ61_020408 [Rhynchospora tenuis]